ncbi:MULTISPECIES: ABC-2 transporter permease [Lactobacillus]|jgi:hypothetical protein|uniref:AciE n=1 Tax=Lactobacillus acidophilus TaxID=1579 RepID=A0A0C5GB26_LACAI|nr:MULTISPECIES: ABC-2 transporter permease [Lactobacillus]AJP07152.1 AciE [Lactobacillus acidophilus]MDU8985004.1 ABC-2 transporter permease [Staphylococcus epidermidis]MBO3731105.1 ABC-2 transporter permease [Lactobacillus paragasseri]MCZ3587395.1 ABC-2 transporter permease [Lactobacillus gasseri]MED7633857.1 ABC-2 transporter permease [Lactobacillus paragasseri]
MKGLVQKDIYQLTSSWFRPVRIFFVIAVLAAGMIFLKQDSSIILVLLLLLMVNNIQSLFIKDSTNRWLSLLKSLKISTFAVIGSRYITLVVICVCGAILNFVYMLFGMFLFNTSTGIDVLVISSICLWVSLIYGLVIIPFLYAFKQNGLTLAIIIMFSCVALLIKFSSAITKLAYIIHSYSYIQLILIAIVALIGIGIVSMVVSYLIVEKEK